MPRYLQRIRRKDHRPGNVARPAVQLAVDEIAEASEEQTGRPAKRDHVSYLEDRTSVPPREERDRDRHSRDRTVEGQPTPPNGKCLPRMCSVLAAIVDEDVHETCSDQHSRNEIHDEVIEISAAETGPTRLNALQHKAIAQHVSDYIHHAVPSERDWADRDYRGRNARIWNYHAGRNVPGRGGTWLAHMAFFHVP